MSLGDVHHHKLHLAPIFLIKLVEGRNLPPEWRSGIASENKNYGPMLLREVG
jgi:hypothetical protein